jgi:hypothetical protein
MVLLSKFIINLFLIKFILFFSEIFNFSGSFLDETIMKAAVENDCSLFLE